MANSYSITLYDNDEEPKVVNDITFDALNPQAVTLKVYLNGSDAADSDAFDILTDLQSITITRQLGTVTIVPSTQNKTNYDKIAYITFYNRGDSTVFTTLSVTHEHIEYSIEVDSDYEVTADGSIKCKPFVEEEHIFNVRVYGGQRKFYVNTVNKYATYTRTTTSTTTTRTQTLTYDNVLTTSISLANDSNADYADYAFTVTTYGVLEVGATYEIVLSHWNARDVQNTIAVSFEIDSEEEPPTLTSSQFTYCTAITSTSTPSDEEETVATTTALSYAAPQETALEETNVLSISYDGNKNPSIIDITDGEVKAEVNTKNPIYAHVTGGWCSVRYENGETPDKRYVYFRAIQDRQLTKRYTIVKLYDMTDKTNYVKFFLLQRSRHEN